jgi:hypothetical protein
MDKVVKYLLEKKIRSIYKHPSVTEIPPEIIDVFPIVYDETQD